MTPGPNRPKPSKTTRSTFVILGGTALIVLIVLAAMFYLFTYSGLHGKDLLVDDMHNIAAHAYAYKIRSAEMRGGGGCYDGYTIPSRIAVSEYGRYTVVSASCSTLAIEGAASEDASKKVQATVNADGVIGDWVFEGAWEK